MSETLAIDLRCSKCGTTSAVPYTTLYSIWRQGYEEMPEDRKEDAYMTAEINCICGHREKFESPMFRHVFKVVFEEFSELEE